MVINFYWKSYVRIGLNVLNYALNEASKQKKRATHKMESHGRMRPISVLKLIAWTGNASVSKNKLAKMPYFLARTGRSQKQTIVDLFQRPNDLEVFAAQKLFLSFHENHKILNLIAGRIVQYFYSYKCQFVCHNAKLNRVCRMFELKSRLKQKKTFRLTEQLARFKCNFLISSHSVLFRHNCNSHDYVKNCLKQRESQQKTHKNQIIIKIYCTKTKQAGEKIKIQTKYETNSKISRWFLFSVCAESRPVSSCCCFIFIFISSGEQKFNRTLSHTESQLVNNIFSSFFDWLCVG